MGFPGNCKALLGIKVQIYYSVKKAYILNENIPFYIVYCIFNYSYMYIHIQYVYSIQSIFELKYGGRPHPYQCDGRSQPSHPLTAGMASGFDVVCLAAGYTMSNAQSMKRELKLNWRQVMNIQDWNDVRKHPLFWPEQFFFQHCICYFPPLEMNFLPRVSS